MLGVSTLGRSTFGAEFAGGSFRAGGWTDKSVDGCKVGAAGGSVNAGGSAMPGVGSPSVGSLGVGTLGTGMLGTGMLGAGMGWILGAFRSAGAGGKRESCWGALIALEGGEVGCSTSKLERGGCFAAASWNAAVVTAGGVGCLAVRAGASTLRQRRTSVFAEGSDAWIVGLEARADADWGCGLEMVGFDGDCIDGDWKGREVESLSRSGLAWNGVGDQAGLAAELLGAGSELARNGF